MALKAALAGSKLKLLVAGLVVVGGGGATYVALGGPLPFSGGDDGMIGTVPADADVVVYFDPGITDDEATATLVDGLIGVAKAQNGTYDGPDSYAEIVANTTAEFPLDTDELDGVTVFGTYPDGGASGLGAATPRSQYGAALIDSEWSESAFMDLLANDTVYETEQYQGYTVHVQKPTQDDTPDWRQDVEHPTWVGVIAEGTYVVGNEAAVKDALDVDRGAAPAVDGQLRTSFAKTAQGSNAYFRYAARIPEGELSNASRVLNDTNLFGAFRHLETVAGSYYTTGDRVGVQTRLRAGSAEDASDLKEMIEGGVALSKQFTVSEEGAALLDDTEVATHGSTVTVTSESSATAVVDAVNASITQWERLAKREYGDSGYGAGFGGGSSFQARAAPANAG
ncbi:MAG: hypothetical protein ABEJ31_00580 [Haloarculaceae archaeon]